jgi:serine/threonine-protein kinase
VAISPDGTQIAYVAASRLYLRPMSELEGRPITGTDQDNIANPVFSPDGRSIAFYATTGSAIKRIAVSGGAAVTIARIGYAPFGMSWGTDGILFVDSRLKGVFRVAANGGKPELLAGVKDGEVAYGPQMLPDGQHVLFTVLGSGTSDQWDKARIVVESLKSHDRKTVFEGGSDARFLPTGHIVYAVGGVLFAIPFDVRRLEVSGGSTPIVEGVRRATAGSTAAAFFSVSDNGSLIYSPGPVSDSSVGLDVALIDRNGTTTPLKLPPARYEFPRVSPDGTRIAVQTDDGKDANVWIYELSRTTSVRRLTNGGRNRFPIWSSDSQRVAFQSDREGDLGIFWQPADGSGTAERLTKPDKDTAHVPESWSPDGKRFIFAVTKGSTNTLWTFSLPDKKAVPFGDVQSMFLPAASFSPDGRWVAYTAAVADASGISVFVQPFPITGPKYLVAGLGIHPWWSPDGKELLYRQRGQAFAVSVTTQPTFAFGHPMPVNAGPIRERGPQVEREHDMTRDGKRFVGVIAGGTAQSATTPASQLQVVLNWFEELKARVPTK